MSKKVITVKEAMANWKKQIKFEAKEPDFYEINFDLTGPEYIHPAGYITADAQVVNAVIKYTEEAMDKIFKFSEGEYVWYKHELRKIIGRVVVDYDIKYLLAADGKLKEVYVKESELTRTTE